MRRTPRLICLVTASEPGSRWRRIPGFCANAAAKLYRRASATSPPLRAPRHPHVATHAGVRWGSVGGATHVSVLPTPSARVRTLAPHSSGERTHQGPHGREIAGQFRPPVAVRERHRPTGPADRRRRHRLAAGEQRTPPPTNCGGCRGHRESYRPPKWPPCSGLPELAETDTPQEALIVRRHWNRSTIRVRDW